jgi:MFS family permease
MRSLVAVLIAVVLAFLTWGLYGPLLHEGQFGMRNEVGPSSLRPFICVGVAYFLIAVVVPVALLYMKGEEGQWSMMGAIWSVAAGAAGAVGALGIIWAFKFRGNPVYVMPLVFGLAPVVNTFVTMFITHTYRQASVLFFAAVVLVAVGAAGVLFFKPVPKNVEVSEADDGKITIKETYREGVEETVKTTVAANLAELQTNPDYRGAYRLYLRSRPLSVGEFCIVLAAIAMTALCWGSYGPVLHKGQMKMKGSRLRPFLCVGLAYFAIAVVVPTVILAGYHEPGQWTVSGTIWSLAAGAAGAVGALGIILAFTFGGRPIYVMPLVFGGAPVVNTAASVIQSNTYRMIGTPFYVSLLLVIVGAICVLVLAPRPGKHEED